MQRNLMATLVVIMVLTLVSSPVGTTGAVGVTLYVAPNGLTTGSCASWANACNLRYALGAAAPGSALWVKQGTYHPTRSTERTVSFVLRNEVALFGGFAGTETALTQRNPVTNVTVLSGDIGLLNNTSDNSYHVLLGGGTNNTAILDGFTVRAGNANGDSNNDPYHNGGGMLNEFSSPTLRNITFSGNAAYEVGGGMYNYSSNPTLVNVTFSTNSANWGGGMGNAASNPTLTEVTFSSNLARWGGGIYNISSGATLTDVTFSSNSATSEGGGMSNFESSPILMNVTFSGNRATSGGGMSNTSFSRPTLTNVTFSSNVAGSGGGMANHSSSSPALTEVTFSSNSATSEGGGMSNFESSPILRNVTFSGNSAKYGGGMSNTSFSRPTLTNVTFSSNVAGSGGGMYNFDGSEPTLMDVTFSGNLATIEDGSGAGDGGGMYNYTNSNPMLTDVTFSSNSALWHGGGMANYSYSSPALTNVTFSGNSARKGAGMFNHSSSPALMDVIFSGNSAMSGGGMYNWYSSNPTLTNVTFSGNATIDGDGVYEGHGGGIYNSLNSSPALTNVTFSGNSALFLGGGMYNRGSSPALTNVTFSSNSAISSGGGMYNYGSSPVIRNTILYGDTGGAIISSGGGSPVVSYSDVQGGYPGTGNIDTDPLLSPLATNGGFTKTMALRTGSPAIDAGDDANCPTQDQRGVTRPQGNHCDMGAYEAGDIKIIVGGTERDSYALDAMESTRRSYAGVNSGPVKIMNIKDIPLITAERVIYKVNGVDTSFSEMMGMPGSQLDTTYWLPWYNNVDLDTQLRFANAGEAMATVHVFIGEAEMTGSPLTLLPGESARRSFAGINAGPVKIVSDVHIVAAERIIYRVSGIPASFAEMMALPDSQVDRTYWLPWYNNKDLDTQLRLANVADSPASVRIYIRGQEMQGSPFVLLPGESTRKSFAGINAGPVKIESNVDIVAAERIIYKVNGISTSFSEMMALPNSQLDNTYWFPWYNSVGLDTQLRFANVGAVPATVHVYIGGEEMPGSPFALLAGESARQSFAGVNNGPVQIVSDVPIVASQRVIYKVNHTGTSFSEMMGLPDGQLDTIFWLPWYNNKDMDTQLRFGIP